jgi:hypothetical protein
MNKYDFLKSGVGTQQACPCQAGSFVARLKRRKPTARHVQIRTIVWKLNGFESIPYPGTACNCHEGLIFQQFLYNLDGKSGKP